MVSISKLVGEMEVRNHMTKTKPWVHGYMQFWAPGPFFFSLLGLWLKILVATYREVFLSLDQKGRDK